ncbi:hypothetical protein JOD52_002921 [Brachybacterium muris]|uniref:hypothetical protein n=1 Tax=Brachybacterium muris TaxID=219301 RepID=UPI00195A6C80|nr:hypothetical protein [Brachybacterium muris]MBM7502081.1 hypothetical protein [Brachybacterium muris]
MSRNHLYSLVGAVLVIAAVIVSIASAVRGELGGVAVLLVLAAGGAAILRIRSRIRSESRHRWVVQARVAALETALREARETTSEQLRETETLLNGLSFEVRMIQDEVDESATYTQMALLHDRVLSLEASLHPVRR